MVSIGAIARASAQPNWAEQFFDAMPELRTDAEEWFQNTSPTVGVGSAHHTVARCYLQRFAGNDQLRVRDRVTGKARTETINRVGAITDFYTFINTDGSKDGRLEQALCRIEDEANKVIETLLNPFRRPRPLTPGETAQLAVYIAAQIMRTPGHRREEELMTDYAVRTRNRTVPGISNLEVVPAPNQHLNYMCRSLPVMTAAFLGRPITLITLDAPLFIVGDEPVIGHSDTDHVVHLPNCAQTSRKRAENQRKPSRNRRRKADILHVYPTHIPPAATPQAALALTPRTLLVIGPRGEAAAEPIRLTGTDAIDLADYINGRLTEQAFTWIAAHPDHPTFESMALPAPGPLINVCDGGTAISKSLSGPPTPRRPALLGRTR